MIKFYFGLKVNLTRKTALKTFFFWSSPNFGEKIRANLSKELFFGLHLFSRTKTVSCLGQDRFILFSTAPLLLQIPGYAPGYAFVLLGLGYSRVLFVLRV